MGRIARTIELAKASWAVLRADKELLILPVISAIASIVIIASFALPVMLSGSTETFEPGPVQYVTLAILYVALAYVTIFFNAALVFAANERINGGDPTLGSALRGAMSHAGRIFAWALVSATVSMILRALEDRGGIFGSIAASLAGIAWSLVTFLVLPVLVVEEVGVRDALSRSGRLFKQTWGENVAAQVGFGILGFLAALVAIPIIILGVAAGGIAIAVAIVIAVAWIALTAVVLAALNAVFQVALYHYATTGAVPGGSFSETTLSGAFAPKSRRSF